VKISVLSDCHLGSGYNTLLEGDAFDNFSEALEKSSDCDVILIAGDLFDSRSPRTTVWARALSLLTKPMLKSSGVKLVSSTKNIEEIHKRTLESVPVVCLHGNHDRRMRNETNAVQAIDSAGMLIHLHKQNVVFEKDGVKVAIHGMSSVPERFAKKEMLDWNPQPIQGCFNILVIHQNVDPYVYSPLEPPSINLEDLPKGFDLILDGHIHTKVSDVVDGTPFMILGSTVTTQFDKKEAETQKGFYKINCESGKKVAVDFLPIEGNRKFFYREFSADDLEKMRIEIERWLSEISTQRFSKTPIVKARIIGNQNKPIDHDLAVLRKKFSERMILNFVKQLESPEVTEKMEFMKNLREQKLSVEEIGLKILRENLGELKFSPSFNSDDMFNMLSEGTSERALAVITGDQKALYSMVSGKK
jgi:DNA repair exonuclease SbcCD nuclease subunit